MSAVRGDIHLYTIHVVLHSARLAIYAQHKYLRRREARNKLMTRVRSYFQNGVRVERNSTTQFRGDKSGGERAHVRLISATVSAPGGLKPPPPDSAAAIYRGPSIVIDANDERDEY